METRTERPFGFQWQKDTRKESIWHAKNEIRIKRIKFVLRIQLKTF